MSETRTAKVKRNITTSLLLQLLKMVLVFVNRFVFVRVLGASYLGLNGLFSNVLQILSIADLGMTTVLMYSLYKPLADKDDEKIAAYINAFKKIYNTVAIVVLLSGIAIIPFLHLIINLPTDVGNIYTYYSLMLINTVLGYLFVFRTTLLQADQKGYKLDLIDGVSQIVLFAVQLLVLLVTKDYTLYLTSNVVTTLITNLVKTSLVNKTYPYLKTTQRQLSKNERKRLFANTRDIFMYRIGGVIQSNTDNILTSIFVGTVAVGYYSNYTMIILAVTGIITLIFNAVKASVGSFNVEAPINEQKRMFDYFEIYNYILVAFCSTVFIILFPDFIRIFFGKSYELDLIVVIMIVANFYTSNIRQNLWVYRETTGLFSKIKYVTLITSILNIILSIVGGHIFGIAGIIGATVLSRMLYAWWKEPKIIYTEYFKLPYRSYIYSYIRRIIYVAIVTTTLVWLMAYIKIDNELLCGVVHAIVSILLASVLYVLPFIKTEAIHTLIWSIKK